MMNVKKGLVTAFLAAVVALSGIGSAVAAQVATTINAYYAPIHYEFDGKYLVPPEQQQGFIYEGSTYVPLRFVAYALDKAVDWEPKTYTVTIREPSKLEQVSIGEYKMNREVRNPAKEKVEASKLQPTPISVYFEQVIYVFDGEEKEPPEGLPGLIYQDNLYVPLRFVSESTGKEIEWDPVTYTVKAFVAGQVEEPSPEEEVEEPETPATTPAPQTGGSGGSGGGGGNGAVKPSKDSLVFQAGLKLYSLQSSAQSRFNSLKAAYDAAETEEAKAQIVSEGQGELDRIKAEVEVILKDLENQLESNGYDISIVEEIRSQFQDIVNSERAKLGL